MSTRPGRLQKRLAVSFFLLSVIVSGVTGFAIFSYGREELREAAFLRLDAVAKLEEDQITLWLDDLRRVFVLFATSPDVRERAAALIDAASAEGPDHADLEGAHDALAADADRLLKLKADFREVLLLTEVGGRVAFSTDPEREGDYRLNDGYFKSGRRGVSIQSLYPSPISGRPTVTISAPVTRPSDDEPVGVLAAHLDLDYIDRVLLQRAGVGERGETYLVDELNVFISAQRFGTQEFPRGVHTEGIDAAIQGRDGRGLYRNYRDVPVVGVYRWVEVLEAALLAEVPQEEAFAPADRLARTVLILGFVVAVVLALGVHVLARRIADPIAAISRTAAAVASGQLDEQAPVTTSDEIGQLGEAFNDMTGQLREAYARLTQANEELERRVEERTASLEAANQELDAFAHSVSHDLKARLRHVTGFCRMLLRERPPELDATTQRRLETIAEAAERMQALIDDLLRFSRTSRLQVARQRVELDSVLEEAIAELGAEGANDSIAWQLEKLPAVRGDRALLRIVLVNLLSNALKFTKDEPGPRIRVSAEVGEEARVVVEDNGVGFDMRYDYKLFQVFKRLHREDDFPGTGIGLATVRRIVEKHGGKVFAESTPGEGARFGFTLPLAETSRSRGD